MKRARSLTDLLQKAKEITPMRSKENDVIHKYHCISEWTLQADDLCDAADHSDDLDTMVEVCKVEAAKEGHTQYIVQLVRVVKPTRAPYDVVVEEK